MSKPDITSYQAGLRAEFMARMYLRLHGFRILKSRYTTGRGTGRAEIDIIAKRKNLIIFVEVKKRKNITTALDAITPAQIRRLRRAAETYLMHKRINSAARFDVIIVTGWKIHWARGII